MRRFEFQPFNGLCWRMVEARSIVATAPLVDTLDEQAQLEELLDATKPPVPLACRHLHPLLYTPFRHRPKAGSRFRRAGQKEGAYYTAEHVETAAAEMAFYRLLFYAESPDTVIPADFDAYTAFAVAVATSSLIDITADTDPSLVHLSDDTVTQAFADAARAAGATGLREHSVCGANHGAALTWFSSEVFDQPAPVLQQSWRIRFTRYGVQAVCEAPRIAIQFEPRAFTSDLRISDFDWSRAS